MSAAEQQIIEDALRARVGVELRTRTRKTKNERADALLTEFGTRLR